MNPFGDRRAFPLVRMAKVVNDDDSSVKPPFVKKRGQVQVQILPELADVDGTKCPWAMPWSASRSGVAQDIGRHAPPEKDAFVWVRIEDPYFNEVYYLDAAPFASSFYPYEVVAPKITVDGSYSPTYPQPRFEALPDGSIVFWDTKDGNMGVQHVSGAYVYVDQDGQLSTMFVKKFILAGKDGNVQIELDDSGKKMKITAQDVEIVADSVKVKDGGDSLVIFKPLSDLLKKLLTHIHVSPAGPTTPAMEPNQTPLSALQSKLPDMKSTVIKSD